MIKASNTKALITKASINSSDLNMPDLLALDTQNRETALNLQSFIVEAPAGAGKTELLTQRYLKLLAVVDEPEEIVALTFSNKATAEMRNRILLSLEHAKQQTVETAPHKLVTRDLAIAALNRSQARNWHLMTQPARLQIMTIDALCSSLARKMPLLSRFGGQPIVSDTPEAHYDEAARRTLAEVLQETLSSDTVTTALRYMDNDAAKLSKLIANMLAKRDQWLPLIGAHTGLSTNDIALQIEYALQHLIEQDLQRAVECFTQSIQIKLMPLARFAASLCDDSHIIKHLLDWELPLNPSIEDLPSWQAITELLLTQKDELRKKLDKKVGFPPGENKHEKIDFKQKKEDFLQLITEYPQLEELSGIRKLPDIAEMANNAHVIRAISNMLRLATAHLWIVFQAANEVDFVEIANCARLALGDADSTQGVSDLALKLDYQIKHLLIDEFQDTSPTQMKLIEQLIQGWQLDDGRTLFCVGDPMQSIYRFRKADVSLFLQASTIGIGQLPLTPLRLSRNNRSHPIVIDWINHAFKSVFPLQDNTAAGAISYRPFTATKPQVNDESINVHPIIYHTNSEDLSANAIEAKLVAKLIQQEKQKNNGHKIAVLVRSRSHLYELVSEIKRHYPHLIFQALEIEGLSNRQTIQDALSLTYALLHRADRVHWLSILRAPWCGLTLSDLHKLCADDQRSTIWQLMRQPNRLATLSEDGQQRLLHVHSVLAEALNNQGRMPLRRWLESTWLKLGGAGCLVEAGDIRDIQAYFDLVEKLSLANTLDFLQLESAMQKLYAKPDVNADGSLQFLTIHKSKGLEFDVVILPALNRKPRDHDTALICWEELQIQGETHLIAAPFVTKKKGDKTSVYHYLQELENTRSINEAARLLYVAVSRSIKQLHLIATIKPNQDGTLNPTKKSFLALLWSTIGGEFLREFENKKNETQELLIDDNAHLNEKNSSLELADFVPKLMRVKHAQIPALLVADIAAPSSQITSFKLAQNSALAVKTISEQRSASYKNLNMDSGTLAHLYMEIIAKTGIYNWSSERLNKLQPAMMQWLIQRGHSSDLAKTAVAEITLALQTTLQSKDGIWLLQAREQAFSELSLIQMNVLAEENTITKSQNYRIDRTFVADGVRWIIDYKLTFIYEGIDLVKVANNHKQQLARYAALFKDENLVIQQAVMFLSLGLLIKI